MQYKCHKSGCFYSWFKGIGVMLGLIGHPYAPPTNPSVATLIRTVGGNTDRKEQKQARRVDPVVNM